MLEMPPQQDTSALPDSAADDIAAIDQEILLLLSRRFALARTSGEGAWLDEDERRAGIGAIRSKAFELGVPVSLVVDFWDRLADASAALNHQAQSR